MATFDTLIHSIPKGSEGGVPFEHICKWYLENDPKYTSLLKKVWLWDDWPGNWGRDKGIDLIAEAKDGTIWAIQSKFYDEDANIKKADIDSWLSESNRKAIDHRLLIATTADLGSNARETIQGQEKSVSICLIDDLRSAELNWPRSINSLQTKHVAKPKSIIFVILGSL